MFSGIVEDCGRVEYIRSSSICISSALYGSETGDSIMVDGVCLTVTRIKSDGVYEMDIGNETRKRTALAALRGGSKVNLERAMRLSDRLNGHIVYGHVMETGKVISIRNRNNTRLISIRATKDFTAKLKEKGSIAVSGVSLTLNSITEDRFEVGIIPETIKRTNLGQLTVSSLVNLEADMLLMGSGKV